MSLNIINTKNVIINDNKFIISPNNGRPSSLLSGAIGMYYRVYD